MKYYSFIIWYSVESCLHFDYDKKEYINKTLYNTASEAAEASEIIRAEIAQRENILSENMGVQFIIMQTLN